VERVVYLAIKRGGGGRQKRDGRGRERRGGGDMVRANRRKGERLIVDVAFGDKREDEMEGTVPHSSDVHGSHRHGWCAQ
jgi:hypothetical protein